MANEFRLPSRMSYSAFSTYAECGAKYMLSRGYKLGRETWYATLAGTAIHNITQIMDLQEIGLELNGVPAEFQDEFDRLIQIEQEKGTEIRPSGRVLKEMGANGGPNKKDYEWWLTYGPAAINKWSEWKAESGFFLLRMPDGRPGIEIAFTQMAGEVPLVGFIDRVYANMKGEVVVVDLKSGKLPSGHLQLATYGLGLKRETGIKADRGSYWMAHDGKLTSLVDLSQYSEAYVDSLYDQAWRGIHEGIFLPNVTGTCKSCVVRDWCRAVGGKYAMSIPVTPKMKDPESNGEERA